MIAYSCWLGLSFVSVPNHSLHSAVAEAHWSAVWCPVLVWNQACVCVFIKSVTFCLRDVVKHFKIKS